MATTDLTKLKAALQGATDALMAAIEALQPAPAPVPVPTPVPTPQPAQHVAVVSYFYPGVQWDTMLAKFPTANLCIINPNSGPGLAPSGAYTTQIAKAKAAGFRVLGYLTTNYRDVGGPQGDGVNRTTPLGPIGEINKYISWYPMLDGFFMDEMDGSASALALAYYKEIYDYCKARALMVVHNPGARCAEANMSVADVLMTFEGSPAAYRTRVANAWEASYPASRFWHCLHDVLPADCDALVDLSKTRNCGLLYMTGASYAQLPTFLDALCARVKG